MTTITLDEIQRNLIGYLRRVEAGETLVLLEDDKPVAEIKPLAHTEMLRPYALCAAEFRAPDDFDAALPDELVEQFEGQ